MSATTRVDGLVLCRAAGHGFAVPALDVASIGDALPGTPWAGRCYSKAAVPPGGRLLWHTERGVVVDSVEVWADSTELLAVPALLGALLGGALKGFAVRDGTLWPVVALGPFAKYLEGLA